MAMDGSDTVICRKTPKDATYKQQKLWFKWCGEVASSGLGKDDNTNDVHITSKWRFVRPILLEETELFGIIYDQFITTIEGSLLHSEYCKEFADKWIHTNDLSRKGRVKSLNEFQRYWIMKGIDLTDPSLEGLDLGKMEARYNQENDYT
jgi:hypothetical protein